MGDASAPEAQPEVISEKEVEVGEEEVIVLPELPAEEEEAVGDKQAQPKPQPSKEAEELQPALKPAPAPTPAPKKNGVSIYPALAATLSNADTIIGRVDRLLSTSSGLETVLSTINYTSSTLHHLLSSRLALALISRLRLRRTHPQPATTTSFHPLSSLSSLISETRTSLRLLGLIPLCTWGSHTLSGQQSRDPLLHRLELLQVFLNIIYQALENVAFLAEKGVVSKSLLERRGGVGRWYIWSTRAWLGHVLLEFVRLAREHALRKRRQAEAGSSTRSQGQTPTLTPEEAQAAREKELYTWKKSLVNNLCWAPLCVHWSFEQGAGVPEEVTGFISLMAGVWGLRDSWRATAKAS
ncbi:hypothetical protein FQN54_007912 [Arachnomyces sp. PD_36]|nr:hypothetical protein FQN54_007912 [Arachnomyces sp. PD_36]